MSEPEQTQAKPTSENQNSGSSLSFWQIVGSTMSAALGVQKKANKERDFAHGKPIHFITAGIIFTATFVIVMILVVRFVLSVATA